MVLPTLILPPRYTLDSIALSQAAERAGWSVERLPSSHVPKNLEDCPTPVFHGDALFVEAISKKMSVKLLSPALDTLLNLPEEYRQRYVRLATLKEARVLLSTAFVKPLKNKSFPAAVYLNGRAVPKPFFLSKKTPVLLAEPVMWDVEFRMFILNGKVAAFSPYKLYGESAQTDDGRWITPPKMVADALEFTEEILSDPRVDLPSALVLDVGFISKRSEHAVRHWAVVDANAAWSSELYGCDPDAVLSVLREACFKLGPV